MIPASNTITQIDNLPGEEIEFGIGDARWVMRTQAELYSDVTTAIIREYSTNAYDAHVMLTLNSLDKAERFVTTQQQAGIDVRWDGWDLVFFRPADHGYYSKNGAYRNGVWGVENRAAVNGNGEWVVDRRDVRRSN